LLKFRQSSQSSAASLLQQRHRKRNEIHSQIVGELTDLRSRMRQVSSSASDPAEISNLQVPTDSNYYMVRDSSSMEGAELSQPKIDEEH